MTMSLLESLFPPGTIERLGWMLVHVLWQAAAVAVLLAILLRLLGKTSANVRYAIACSALALTVALPIVTIRWIKVPGPVAEAGPPSVSVATPPVTASTAVQTMAEVVEEIPLLPQAGAPLQTADVTVHVPLQERITSTLKPALPYVVLGWLVGVFGLSAWHLGGWTQLQRLKRRMVHEIGNPLQRRLADLSARLGVHRAVGLLESALVEVPTVVGWLRPVILLPASALTGLRLEQLEAILAHELAHIRRYDYLVNMLQTVVEILGFYHPAIWWISHRIRIERENCCDDLAVHVCGSSLQYARALACMEEIRHSAGDLAVAVTGGSLSARIHRVLRLPNEREKWSFSRLAGPAAAAVMVGLLAAILVQAEVQNRALAATSATGARTEDRSDEMNTTEPPVLGEIWGKLSALDAERFESARHRWEALTVVEQAQRVLRDWTQRGPTEQERQTVMTEEGARRFLAQAQKQLGEQWPAHLRGHMENLLTQAERSQFNSRRQALVQEAAAFGESVVKALVREISTEGPQRSAASDALKQIGAPAVPALLEAVDSTQRQPRWMLLGVLTELKDPRAAEAFRRLLDDPDAHTRLPALQGLEKLHRASQDTYLRCLEDDYDWLRREAVSGLAETGDEQAIPALFVVAHHDLSRDKLGGSWLGQEAFQAIQKISQRTGKPIELPPQETWREKRELTFELLSAAARCSNAGIRQEAITALAFRYHDKRTLELFMTLVGTDPTPKVRAAAALGIGQLFANMGPEAKPLELNRAEREPLFNTLLDLLGDKTLEPSLQASTLGVILAVAGPNLPDYPRFPESFDVACRSIEGTDRAIQLAGLNVLSRLGYTHPKALQQYATPEVRERLMPLLLAGMEDREVGYRIRFIEALGYLRERSIVPRLIQLLGDPDAIIRTFAVQALGCIGDPRALPALEQLAQHDPATDYKGEFYLRKAAGKAIEQIRAADPPGAATPEPKTTGAPNTKVQIRTLAESQNASAENEAAQVLLEFKITKVQGDLRPDRETLLLMANALGAESPLARALSRPGRKLDMTMGEILKRYVVPQSLSAQAGEAMIDLLRSRGYLEVSVKPSVLTLDGKQVQVRIVGEQFLAAPDSAPGFQRVEYGTVITATSHVLDRNRVSLEIMAEVSDLVPGPADSNELVVSRTSAETNVAASNGRYLVWAVMEPTTAQAGPEASRQSVYIMVKPRINLPPTAQTGVGRESTGPRPRQVLLEVRTVTAERDALGHLDIQWSQPSTKAGVFPGPSPQANSATPGSWPSRVQIGSTPDREFTQALLAALDQLYKDHQVEISSQQILVQDGRQSQVKALLEEWSPSIAPPTQASAPARTEFHKTESGTILAITPRITESNDITVEIALETSRSLPKAPGSDVPVITRLASKSTVTIKDGGTVAVGGLTENRAGSPGQSSRELAVFVTARLAPAEGQEPAKPTVQISARFVAVERLLRDLRGRGAIRGVTSRQETEALHEMGRRMSEGTSLVLTDDQAGLLMKATQGYSDCTVLAAPKVMAHEDEQVSMRGGSKIPYTAGYEEANEPGGPPKPRQATLDSGLKFEILAHLIGPNEVKLDGMLRITTLLGFDEKKYKSRHPYQVPRTDDVVLPLNSPALHSGSTALILGPQARLKASGRPQTLLILVTPSVVEGTTSPAATDATAR
jgi:type II secretory pathway component GspD/PulD (secretin)/beta-lactamase regulating signal transducer with metallopeptidase domain/HEAT repeat protein